MSWDSQKLDALLEETEAGFYEELREDEAFNRRLDEDHDPAEERNAHALTGYFMLRLLDCNPGAKLRGQPPATITGPLFAALGERPHSVDVQTDGGVAEVSGTPEATKDA